MSNFTQIIGKLNEDYQSAIQSNNGDGYSRLSTILGELESVVREYIQDITEDQIKNIIEKLKNGDDISIEDKDFIRLWIVGDADYYTKLENNFEDWKKELDRLMGEINHYQIDNPDVETASKLRGLFRDASRVIADIFYFTQQRERIERFQASTDEIDQTERAILIRLLEQKIKSSDF